MRSAGRPACIPPDMPDPGAAMRPTTRSSFVQWRGCRKGSGPRGSSARSSGFATRATPFPSLPGAPGRGGCSKPREARTGSATTRSFWTPRPGAPRPSCPPSARTRSAIAGRRCVPSGRCSSTADVLTACAQPFTRSPRLRFKPHPTSGTRPFTRLARLRFKPHPTSGTQPFTRLARLRRALRATSSAQLFTRLGSQSTISGKARKSPTVAASARKKGRIPRKTSARGMSGRTAATT